MDDDASAPDWTCETCTAKDAQIKALEDEAAHLRHERDEHMRIRFEGADVIKALADALEEGKRRGFYAGWLENGSEVSMQDKIDAALRLAGRLP